MRAPSCRRTQAGFTLVELAIVAVIMGVLAALAGPSFRTMIAAQRVKNAASELFADLALARSEAIRRNANVTISPVSTSWANGWTITAGADTIKQRGAVASSISVAKKTGTDDQLVFAANGRSTGTFRMNFTAAVLTLDDQKRCVSSTSAEGQKILRGPC